MSTIQQVARHAKVSTATVSRVLNAHPGVTAKTRERVQRAMSAVDYRPSAYARALSSGHSNLISFLVPDLRSDFFGALLSAADRVAEECGFAVLLANSDNDPARERRLLQNQHWPAGLLWCPVDEHAALSEKAELIARKPIVIVDRASPGFYSVSAQHRDGGRLAGEHLLALGHQRIAFITGLGIASRERFRGYEDALRAAGVDPDPTLRKVGCFDFESGRRAVSELFSEGARFSALVAANDAMAVGAIQELVSRGLKVPEDVSVVGFDDIPLAATLRPALTTIVQPVVELATMAVQLLFRLIHGELPKKRQIRLPVQLIIRQSSARCS